jgi:hypothetical protein
MKVTQETWAIRTTVVCQTDPSLHTTLIIKEQHYGFFRRSLYPCTVLWLPMGSDQSVSCVRHRFDLRHWTFGRFFFNGRVKLSGVMKVATSDTLAELAVMKAMRGVRVRG